MMRVFDKGSFSFIEFVVFFFICFIALNLVIGIYTGVNYYQHQGSGVYECVKTYIYQEANGDQITSHKRVDLRPQKGGIVETFNCDDFYFGQMNSATIYGQFQPGHYYNVEYTGYRREGYFSLFPNIIAVKEVEVKLP